MDDVLNGGVRERVWVLGEDGSEVLEQAQRVGRDLDGDSCVFEMALALETIGLLGRPSQLGLPTLLLQSLLLRPSLSYLPLSTPIGSRLQTPVLVLE